MVDGVFGVMDLLTTIARAKHTTIGFTQAHTSSAMASEATPTDTTPVAAATATATATTRKLSALVEAVR